MKRLQQIVWLAMLLIGIASASVATAQRYQLSGKVQDSDNNPVAYATVVLLDEGKQVTGSSTEENGGFVLEAVAGEYTLHISYVGYKTLEQGIALNAPTDLGAITIEVDSEKIDEVVVTGQLIRREADRFVVDVANSPIAMGKDGEELLKSAPGVWIQDDKVSINGASGSKIYLNDREVKLDDEQLIAYLRSLRAEDIQRIEVVPQSGADYDASSSGGIIKITTKRRLDSGLMGSASLSVEGTKNLYSITPTLSLNYNRGKVNAYARAWAGISDNSYLTTEHTDYTAGNIIDAETNLSTKMRWGGGNIGVVYDINERHSIGGEVQYNYFGMYEDTDTWTDYQTQGTTTRTDGRYTSDMRNQMVTATLNYIYKLDDMGSTLKLIGDYTNSQSPDRSSYFDVVTDPTTAIQRDSIHRNYALSSNHLGTATIDLEKVLTPKVTLKAGLKYTYSKNENIADYEYQRDELWMPNMDKSYDIGYTENIGAAYLIATANLGPVSLVGGLRGEYTNFRDKAGSVEQNYFDLFPNANISYAITKDGAYSLIAQYARTITRPSFWALTPNEIKISEYMTQRGNPNLKPSYDNSVSVTAVLKYKYTITLGVKIQQNAIQQATIADDKNPDRLILQHMNFPVVNSYFASVNLPFQFTKWWSANFNVMAMYMGQRIFVDDAIRYNFTAFANADMSFTLPKNFFIEVSGNYMHGLVSGNTKMSDSGNMNIILKKRFLNNKLTVKLGVENIIPMLQSIIIEEAEFKRVMTVDMPWSRPKVSFSISYNFNSGKQFRAKSVESGSAEDRGRIGSGNSGN